jgi:transcriptional regulator with XRE-family HTH domain
MNSTHYDHSQLQSLRERFGWTQDQVARALNVDRQTVSRVERGANVAFPTLESYARLLGLRVWVSFLPEKQAAVGQKSAFCKQ